MLRVIPEVTLVLLRPFQTMLLLKPSHTMLLLPLLQPQQRRGTLHHQRRLTVTTRLRITSTAKGHRPRSHLMLTLAHLSTLVIISFLLKSQIASHTHRLSIPKDIMALLVSQLVRSMLRLLRPHRKNTDLLSQLLLAIMTHQSMAHLQQSRRYTTLRRHHMRPNLTLRSKDMDMVLPGSPPMSQSIIHLRTLAKAHPGAHQASPNTLQKKKNKMKRPMLCMNLTWMSLTTLHPSLPRVSLSILTLHLQSLSLRSQILLQSGPLIHLTPSPQSNLTRPPSANHIRRPLSPPTATKIAA